MDKKLRVVVIGTGNVASIAIRSLKGRPDMELVGVWGHPDLPCAAPEESWDLINYYYPLSLQDAIYRHPCIEGPVGFHTGTPHGNIDIIPVEAASYAPYKLIAMVGYNCAAPEDLDKLTAAAEAGATVLIGWPQLSVTTDRADVLALNHQYLQHPFVTTVAATPDFVPQHKDGLEVMVDPAVPAADLPGATRQGFCCLRKCHLLCRGSRPACCLAAHHRPSDSGDAGGGTGRHGSG